MNRFHTPLLCLELFINAGLLKGKQTCKQIPFKNEPKNRKKGLGAP